MIRFLKRSRFILLVLLALPIAIYFAITAQMSWRPRTLKIGAGLIESLAFAADNRTLAIGLTDVRDKPDAAQDELQVWDSQSQSLLQHLPFEHWLINHSNSPFRQQGTEIKLAPDGKTVALGLMPKPHKVYFSDCALWDGHGLKWLNTLNSEGAFVFTDNGQHIKICCDHYNTAEPREHGIVPAVSGEPKIVTLNTINQWNKSKSWPSGDANIVTFDTRTAKMLSHVRLALPLGYTYRHGSWQGKTSPLWTLSPDGNWGAVALFTLGRTTPGSVEQGKMLLFDARTGKAQHVILVGDNPVASLETIDFSATGKYVVTLTDDPKGQVKMQLWDSQTGHLQQSLTEWPLAFAPDDSLWVGAFDSYTLHLHDTQTGSIVRTLEDRQTSRHTSSWSPLFEAAFTSDGTILATARRTLVVHNPANNDGTVKLWRIK